MHRSHDKARGTAAIIPTVGMYAFRSPDPVRLATFWGALMHLPMAPGASPELAMLDFDHDVGPVTWMFEPLDDDMSATGARLGLDLGGDSLDHLATAARAEELGATRVSEHEEDGVRWAVLHDPDGNQFRIFAPRPA